MYCPIFRSDCLGLMKLSRYRHYRTSSYRNTLIRRNHLSFFFSILRTGRKRRSCANPSQAIYDAIHYWLPLSDYSRCVRMSAHALQTSSKLSYNPIVVCKTYIILNSRLGPQDGLCRHCSCQDSVTVLRTAKTSTAPSDGPPLSMPSNASAIMRSIGSIITANNSHLRLCIALGYPKDCSKVQSAPANQFQ